MAEVVSDDRLRRDALTLRHIIASTLANIAPAGAFFFGFGIIVRGAGLAAPITIITAMVAILFLTNTLAEFSRFQPSTGSFVTFVGKAFGPGAAAATSVFVTFGYVVAASAVVAISGGWTANTLKVFLGIAVPWQILTLTVTLAVGSLVMRGVTLSTTCAALFFYFEAGLLLIGALVMLVANPGALSLKPFEVRNLAGGLAGLGAGFPLAVYMFIGWENSAMLAEETMDPRHNIPRALMTGTLAIGVFYVFLAYATAVGFHMDATAMGKAAIPFVDALGAAAPMLLIVAYLAGVTSILSALIGLTNSQARILFNSGREGLLPKFFGKIHPQHRTPHTAMWAFLVIALVLVFAFTWARALAPAEYFGDAGTLGTIPVILVYMATNLALPVYMMRHRRANLKPLRHVVLPVLGTLFMLLPLWGLVEPGQEWPLNEFPWVALVALIISIGYGASAARRMPDLVRRIGTYVADE